jgi:hypothetical protein
MFGANFGRIQAPPQCCLWWLGRCFADALGGAGGAAAAGRCSAVRGAGPRARAVSGNASPPPPLAWCAVP